MHRKPNAIKRLPAGYDGSRYLHPHGYVIERERRTWSERGRPVGRTGHDPAPPLYWWTVYHHIARRRPDFASRPGGFLSAVSDVHHPKEFDTLRDARAWCDANPREGWTV